MRTYRLVAAATLTFLVLFSATSFADWEKVWTNASGDIYYVDFQKIKKNREYVYFWGMSDYLTPTPPGDLSSILLFELDCNAPRKARILSESYYKGSMGQGDISSSGNKPSEWTYAHPNSAREFIENRVCDYAGE